MRMTIPSAIFLYISCLSNFVLATSFIRASGHGHRRSCTMQRLGHLVRTAAGLLAEKAHRGRARQRRELSG